MATSHSQSASQSTSGHSLPDGLTADSIDTLPELTSILSRLQNLSASSATTASPAATSPSQIAAGTGPLTIKDIPAATDELKRKLQRARTQIKELPDVDRSITEQEEEIRELEERIAKQREVLKSLKRLGLTAGKEREGGEVEADAMEV